jgi:outer membrane protein
MIQALFLFLFSASAFASTENILDIKSAIAKGLAFSPDVLKAQSQVTQADGSYRLAEAKLFPTISMQGLTSSNRNSITFLPGGSNAAVSGLYSDTYTAELVATQPIYQGGALGAGISIAKLQQEIANQNYFKAKQDYLQSLLTAYLTAAQNSQQLEMARLNREVLSSYLKVTKQHVVTGRNRVIDQLQAEANYQLSEAEVLRIETAQEQSAQDLLKFIGDTKLAHMQLETHFDLQPVETGTLEQAFERALENNPDLHQQRLQVDLQHAQGDLTLAADMPSLNLTGTAGYNSPDRAHIWDETSKFYAVGMNLTIPLFSGLSSLAQRRVNGEAVVQAEKDLMNKNISVKESMAMAMATVQRNFNQVKLARLAAESARKAMDVAMSEYRKGLVSSSDIINIQSTHYTAETQFLSAQFSYLIQILNLRHDLGVNLEKAYASSM